jgi:hypothetical protein
VLEPDLIVPWWQAGNWDACRGRIAVVTVGALDRRTVAATAFARTMRPDALLAVHVAVDDRAARELGLVWMRSRPGAMPLHIVTDDGGVAATIGSSVQGLLAAGASEVTVLAGRLTMRGVGRRLLHDHTADAIGRALTGVHRTRVVLVPVAGDRL